MDDTISRQAAIDAVKKHYRAHDNDLLELIAFDIERLPPAQPGRLTDDDFETIRIHLNAYKEKLCNQNRWEEAEEYQRIIDRFMAFASAQPEILACGEGELIAQPEIIRCKDCRWHNGEINQCNVQICASMYGEDFCSKAERRKDV